MGLRTSGRVRVLRLIVLQGELRKRSEGGRIRSQGGWTAKGKMEMLTSGKDETPEGWGGLVRGREARRGGREDGGC